MVIFALVSTGRLSDGGGGLVEGISTSEAGWLLPKVKDGEVGVAMSNQLAMGKSVSVQTAMQFFGHRNK